MTVRGPGLASCRGSMLSPAPPTDPSWEEPGPRGPRRCPGRRPDPPGAGPCVRAAGPPPGHARPARRRRGARAAVVHDRRRPRGNSAWWLISSTTNQSAPPSVRARSAQPHSRSRGGPVRGPRRSPPWPRWRPPCIRRAFCRTRRRPAGYQATRNSSRSSRERAVVGQSPRAGLDDLEGGAGHLVESTGSVARKGFSPKT